MIKVQCQVMAWEINGRERKSGESEDYLVVRSHHIRDEWVILEMLEGSRITVSAKDVIAAIQNACNTAR